MNFNHLLLVLLVGLYAQASGQSSCGNPITLSAVIVNNTTCGNATGTIIVTPSGGTAFTFEWDPAVSTINVANNLPAGTYKVHITRANDPDCTLDTTIVLNNSNSPVVTATIAPADCQAANGSITMQPANLQYTWSTGAVTNVIQGLSSGNYYVTATDPNTGCFSVSKIFVPRNVNFNVSVNITKHAKCGKNIGSAQILVPQGSGQYSYSMGNGPVFSGLAAGVYTCQVTDNITGCTGSVTFTIQNLPVIGIVDLNAKNVRCAGDNSGLVEFQVIPLQNFQMPFVFTLVNTAGAPQSPGSLAAGTYYLQVFDADLCPLTPDTFTILQPPPLLVQAATMPENCAEGGAISLNISGGTGANYTVNWLDLPGDVNPEDRSNLEAGLYSAIIYDSLFCTKTVDNLLVAPQCNGIDTVHIAVKFSSTDFFCNPVPPGLGANGTTFSLLGGSLSGNSAFGAWNQDPQGGCLGYSAGPTPGFAVDTICIVRKASQIGLIDTICVIVTITAKAPTKQTVFFSVQTGAAAEACGAIPPQFAHYTFAQIGRPGLSGTSDAYGEYFIHTDNGCLSFFANNVTGFSVDEIRVGVFDTVLNECHVICYLPSVIAAVDCATFLQLPDTLSITAPDCNGLVHGCIPIPYDDIVNYSIIDNGVLYSSGYVGCDPAPAISYNITALPQGGGPYQLTDWTINGESFGGVFLNFTGLASLMNNLNPGQGWAVQGASFIRGGNLASTYGSLKIQSASGVSASYAPSQLSVSRGTELRFSPGTHKVVFRHVLNACADTLIVQADCVDCQPIHSYPTNGQGNIVWTFNSNCAADTVFCSEILLSEFSNYVITDNQQTSIEYIDCGDRVGMVLDTGFHLIHILDTTGNCEYYVRFYLLCNNIVGSDTSNLTIAIGEEQTICLDLSLLSGPYVSIVNLCEDDGSNTLFSYQVDQNQWCIDISGMNLGVGNLCLLLCNNADQCANYLIQITVDGQVSDSLMAVPDHMYTLIDTDVDIPILNNDIVGGIVGNRFDLAAVEILTQPQIGTISFNPVLGIVTYSPNPGACGVDSFTYRIIDSLGQQSQTTVRISIACTKVLVFNGISPNGDGKNDTWHILGIEQYPGNEVRVFNRWGNQVFVQKSYSNANAWDGTWNGKDLPDGTYFYTVNLGGAVGKLEGFLQLLR